MPSPDKVTVKAYMNEEEYEEVKRLASQAKISVSKFVRNLCMGYEPKSKVDQEAILALLRVNQDLSRLGNLFKLALDQEALDESKGQELVNSINKIKLELMEKVRAL